MRTLVVSDLHLGNRLGRDVIRHSAPRERLLAALAEVDRFVLLGDCAELVRRRPGRSLSAAEPILRAIGERMGARRGAEVVLVPGNHDRPLLGSWLRERGEALAPASEVDPAVSPALEQVVSWLGPAAVRVSYPGVWLEDRIYATHGHYLDRHLLPESAFGLPRGRLRAPIDRGAKPSDYERGSRHRRRRRRGRPGARPGLVSTVAKLTVRPVSSVLLRGTPRLLRRAEQTSISLALLDAQMRGAALPAFGRVVRRLGIDADWVIFGHVHRSGPGPSDRADRWRAGADGPRLVNCGSWLYEPLLLDGTAPPCPYWPGGAVLLEPGLAPRPIALLDDLSRRELLG